MAIYLRDHESFYFTDKIITETADLHISEGRVEAQEIYLSLIDELGYTTTERRTVRSGERFTDTEDHHHPFYSTTTTFFHLTVQGTINKSGFIPG